MCGVGGRGGGGAGWGGGRGGGGGLGRGWGEGGRGGLARRAARDGGREGARWRSVGWEAWQQGLRAIAAEEDGDEVECRNGWTVLAALIHYKRRQQRQQKQRRAEKRPAAATPLARPDARGTGVVVFDLETTELVEEDVAVEDMTASVACAMWLPEAATVEAARAGAAARSFWHESVGRAPNGDVAAGMRAMLAWFDGAQLIVAYNGRAFDMRVLKQLYDGDDERWQAHMDKLVDPAEAVRHATGRRVKLSTVLKYNTKGEKGGSGCDAPRWWKEGKHEQLQRYCAQDVQVLVDLVLRPEMRVPGGGVTKGASVRGVLTGSGVGRCGACGVVLGEGDEHEGGTAGGGDGEDGDEEAPVRETRATVRRRAAGGSSAADGTKCAACSAGKRGRSEARYDETQRRKKRVKRAGYMDRGGRNWAGSKRAANVMGGHAMERVVAGRYEWHDRAMGPMTGRRKRYWQEENEPVHRAQRPRTEGG